MIHPAHIFKGKLKFFILKALSEQPLHGYALMKKISSYSFDLWKPTSGSLYPALEELLQSGFIKIKSEMKKGRRAKVYSLTKTGESEFQNLEVQVNNIEQKFMDFHQSDCSSKYGFEDFVYMFNFFDRTLKGGMLEFRDTMFGFMQLSRKGELTKTQEEEFKKAFIAFMKKIESINTNAKSKKK